MRHHSPALVDETSAEGAAGNLVGGRIFELCIVEWCTSKCQVPVIMKRRLRATPQLLASTLAGSLLWFSTSLFVVSCLDRPVTTTDPKGLQSGVMDKVGQPKVDGYDVLFIIDDSISMADKQDVLSRSIERIQVIGSDDGKPISPPVRSIAVLPASLEAAGACSGSSKGARPVYFSDESPHPSEYSSSFTDVGDQGCGYEAPLETMYRFLIDPAPPLSVDHTDSGLVRRGLDEELLELRSRFLAPYSQVIIIIVTDEDDCSMQDTGDAWKLVGLEPLARSTSACADSPTDPCCRSCDSEEQVPPEGCTPVEEDAVCREQLIWDSAQDPLNLRCFDQQRRFGQSNLHPVSRYVDALTSPQVAASDGTLVDNPLFASGRTKDMVTVMLIAGTPWQLLKDHEASQDGHLHLLPPGRFDSEGRWDLLLGPPGVRDAHLLQSIEPRPGLPLGGGAWDPISGHEVQWPTGVDPDLQYSCIFDLPEERTCDDATEDCVCGPDAPALPLCRTPSGDSDNIQRRAAAFPPTRLLQFARELGDQALLGSICPSSLAETTWDLNYGFASAFELLAESRYHYQATDCFEPPLPVDEVGVPRCHAIEGYADPVRCEEIGRVQPDPAAAERFLKIRGTGDGATPNTELTLCEVPPFPGDSQTADSPYYRCQNELHPDLDGPGYCYVDQRLGLGIDELTTGCSRRLARRLRFIPQLYPFLPGSRMLLCDYGQ